MLIVTGLLGVEATDGAGLLLEEVEVPLLGAPQAAITGTEAPAAIVPSRTRRLISGS
jgi:hypothetical protein